MVPTNTALAMAELSADAVFSKIPHEQYRYYLDEPLMAGKRAAADHQCESVDELCKSLGVTVVTEDKSARYGGINLRAQAVTEKGRTTIHLYKDSIQSLVDNSSWEGTQSIDFETAVHIHLYHELYHVLEEKSGSYISDRLHPVKTWRLFAFNGRSHVRRTDEIAAHSFAREMLGLPWLPNFYDYIYLYNQKNLNEQQFADFFNRMQALVTLGEEKQSG